MNTRHARKVTADALLVTLVLVAMTAMTAVPSLAQQAGIDHIETAEAETAEAAPVQTPGPGLDEGAVSRTDAIVDEGIGLYKRGHYAEALDAFNRALVFDPENKNALTYRDKCQGKLLTAAAGDEPDTVPSFESVDAEAVVVETEESPLSLEEERYKRVRELIEIAEAYLEERLFKRALEHYEQALLIAPANRRAKAGYYKARIGASEVAIKEADQRKKLEHKLIEKFTIERKLLPDGAGPDGIKDIRIKVPVAEERYIEEYERNPIEEALESPVSLDFEGEHIRSIIDFISDYVGINIVIDSRVVMPPQEPEAEVAPSPYGPAPVGPARAARHNIALRHDGVRPASHARPPRRKAGRYGNRGLCHRRRG